MIQGVIFDMDGLMFDTERIWATLWEPALAGLGLSYKEGLDEAARGTAGDSMRAVLRRFYGPDCDPDRIIEALHEQGVIAFQAPPPKKPGLDEILAWLEQRHIPMVVASSSRMASIRHHLDGWGLTHYFKAGCWKKAGCEGFVFHDRRDDAPPHQTGHESFLHPGFLSPPGDGQAQGIAHRCDAAVVGGVRPGR